MTEQTTPIVTNVTSPVTYASFWKRTAAYLVDYTLFLITIILILIIVPPLCALLKLDKGYGALLAFAGILGCYLCYFVWAECSSWQATIGKKIFGLKVTNTNGQRISFWRSFLRNIGMQLSFILFSFIFYIGCLMCLWTEKRQCLHDMIASCVVLDTKPNEKQGCLIGVVLLLLLAPFFLGMCAAVSLPQYMRAVERSRAQEAIVLLSNLTQTQQRFFARQGHYATEFQQLDLSPKGATGRVFYTKGDPKTGINGNGFEVTLSENVTFARGFATALRKPKQNTDESVSYTLHRYYADSKTSCIPHNDAGASMCADVCGTDELGEDGSCCTDGTPGRCPLPTQE